ncbi:hypothetical protein B0H21DRAFT_439503 [Amylocystis lapponica]|nr:hypothetical protein B0H21DRAFT_439503 [Amylocystis lapponica]
MMNPNFPSDLDIKPSAAPHSAPSSVGVTDIDVLASADDRFGAAAQENAIRTYGIAGRVWEASYAMLAYLDRNDDGSTEFDPPPFTAGPDPSARTIVELGSGTGLVAARVAAHLRTGTDRILATDLPGVCPLLQANLARCASASVHALPWGSRAHAAQLASALGVPSPASRRARFPTHIVCSDLVYFPALLAPLLRTLLHLTAPPFVAPGAPAQLVLSYRTRSLAKEQPFWAAFGLWFEFAPVLCRAREGSDRGGEWGPWGRFAPGDEETFVFVARRRPESAAWAVPDGDQDLLNGVGAWGTPAGKADDAFEAMLLMGLGIVDGE